MDLREVAQSKQRHPWEISRMEQLTDLILSEIKDRQQVVLADIGAGDLYFAEKLIEKMDAQTISWNLHAVDPGYGEQQNGVWSTRTDDRLKIHSSLDELLDLSLDGLILLDVLEHVEDDHAFIDSLKLKLKPGGLIVSTVPAFQSLFSNHDVFLKHYRRYNLKELSSLFSSHQLTIKSAQYFYFSLFLVRSLLTGLEKLGQVIQKRSHHSSPVENRYGVQMQKGIGHWQLSEASFLTRCLAGCLNLDFHICRILDRVQMHIPGLSVLVVAHKMDQ